MAMLEFALIVGSAAASLCLSISLYGFGINPIVNIVITVGFFVCMSGFFIYDLKRFRKQQLLDSAK
jgi:hypothetical protein